MCLKLVNIWPKSNDLYEQQTFYAIMFSVGDMYFFHKNAISKNTAENTRYLPKVGYIPYLDTFMQRRKEMDIMTQKTMRNYASDLQSYKSVWRF